MENAEKVLAQTTKAQKSLRGLQPLGEPDGKAPQKLSIPSPAMRKPGLERFEKAIRENDHQKFHGLIKGITLSDYQPNEITALIDFCLSFDMISAAFELAAKAVKSYPGNAKIETAYKALSSPKFIGTRPPQAQGMEQSQNWFKENFSQHKGKWVAVNSGRLLAEADSLKELKNAIDESNMNPSTIVEKIF